MLQSQHVKARLEFGKDHLNKKGFWGRVISYVKTKIELFGINECKTVWREKNAELLPKTTIQHGGGSILLRACFSINGRGNIVQVTPPMRKEEYVEILSNNPKDSARKLGWHSFTFVQDDNPKRTSYLAKDSLRDNHIQVLDWPAMTPDLNPIENLRQELKVHEVARKPQKLKDVEAFCLEEWVNIHST